MKEIIISTHIPKCGGTTLKNILNEVYGKGFKWVLQTKFPEEAIKEINFDTVECIHGHVSYGLHKFFPKEISYKYVTFLRNPYDRLLSFYNFLLQNQNTYIVYDWKNTYGWKQDMPFEDWLADVKIAGQDNDVVRFFSGMSNLNTHEITRKVNAFDFRIADENLKTYDFVGNIEDFDNDIIDLAKLLKWKKIPEYKKDNYFPNRITVDDLTDEEVHLIGKTQFYDIALWNRRPI